MAISSGNEVVSVYNIKYVPAVSRSVCCPHRVMMIRVGMRVASNMIYIRVRLDAMNVVEINSCKRVSVVRKIRCRCRGSLIIACWLAMVISGRSQKDSVSRGDETWSRLRSMFDLGSSRVRLSSASINM